MTFWHCTLSFKLHVYTKVMCTSLTFDMLIVHCMCLKVFQECFSHLAILYNIICQKLYWQCLFISHTVTQLSQFECSLTWQQNLERQIEKYLVLFIVDDHKKTIMMYVRQTCNKSTTISGLLLPIKEFSPEVINNEAKMKLSSNSKHDF